MKREFTREELSLIIWGLQWVEGELVHEYDDADTAEKALRLAHELEALIQQGETQ